MAFLRRRRCRFAWQGVARLLVALIATLAMWRSAAAQEAAPPAADPPAANPPAAEPNGGFRQVAPGIERAIDPATQKAESYSWHHIDGLLKQDPKYGERPWSPRNLAKDVRIAHDIWALDFTFKPIRFVTVDVADGAGNIERKTIWYLLYHVKNNSDKPVRFTPRFLLHAHESDNYYPDRILATAIPAIRRREDPKRPLLNSVEISEQEILPSTEEEDHSVWGVATWRDIEPAADRFSVYVQGLTNAYRIETDDDGNWKRFSRKTLQLNFWRPGDEFYQHEAEIRLGIPGDVDYRWVYK